MQQEIRPLRHVGKTCLHFPNPEQKQKVLLVHEPIPISKFAEAPQRSSRPRMCTEDKSDRFDQVAGTKGLCHEVVRNDKRHKEPTASGRAIGITSEWARGPQQPVHTI